MKNFLKKILVIPNHKVLCSQTLYECLFTCIEMFEFSGDDFWRVEVKNVADIISLNQNKDGGFNIGYNFIFGTGVVKKNASESTK